MNYLTIKEDGKVYFKDTCFPKFSFEFFRRMFLSKFPDGNIPAGTNFEETFQGCFLRICVPERGAQLKALFASLLNAVGFIKSRFSGKKFKKVEYNKPLHQSIKFEIADDKFGFSKAKMQKLISLFNSVNVEEGTWKLSLPRG